MFSFKDLKVSKYLVLVLISLQLSNSPLKTGSSDAKILRFVF